MSKRQVRCRRLTPVVLVALAMVAVLGAACKEQPIARTTTEYGWIVSDQVTIVTTGAAGAATGTGATDSLIKGHLYAIHLNYATGISTTTDVTISQADPAANVLIKANSATDAWYYPVVTQTVESGNSAGTYQRMPIIDQLDISVAQSTASATGLIVTVYWGP
jgi:hypothetical protein